MIRVIDLDEGGLTKQQVLDSIRSPEGAILRRDGKVIARLEPADEIDLEDDQWAHAPEQVARGEAARRRFQERASVSHDDVKRQLGGDESGSGTSE